MLWCVFGAHTFVPLQCNSCFLGRWPGARCSTYKRWLFLLFLQLKTAQWCQAFTPLFNIRTSCVWCVFYEFAKERCFNIDVNSSAFGTCPKSQASLVRGLKAWTSFRIFSDCRECVCGCVQGLLVHNMRYLASVVSNCFTAFGELLALNKRFAELSGGVARYPCTPPCILPCFASMAAWRSAHGAEFDCSS